MKPICRTREAGFTLIELMTAMAITLVVAGAIWGLITSSQNSFTREPAISDRQQNARTAVDLITGDVFTAGTGMDAFVQSFTPGLNGTGAPGALYDATNTALWGTPNSDVLEIMSNPGNCPTMTVIGFSNNGANIDLFVAPPPCFHMPAFVYVGGPAGPATNSPGYPPGLLYGFCPTGGCDGHTIFQHGQAPNYNPPASSLCPTGGSASGDCVTMTIIDFSAWAICPDPSDGVMSLWRNNHGHLDPSCTAGAGCACGANPPDPANNWRLVARGIDDLRVRYQDGTVTAPTLATPATIATGNFATIVQQVQVTLSSETTTPKPGQANNLQGATCAASDTTATYPCPTLALRGAVQANVSPRAGLIAASQASPLPLWR
jgi:prepilin-type N-terminal cleavage/methylation domain-containing protein